MMKIFKTICILAVLLCSRSIKTVLAEDLVKNVRFEEDIELSGIISSYTKYFYVDDYMDVKTLRLNLFFTKSELIEKNNSSLTIYLNEKPVSSYDLSEDKVYKNQVTIEIPVDQLQAGYNSLKIEGFKTITDKLVCSEDNNSANWLMIHEETNLNMNYEILPYENQLSEYQRIFMTTDESHKLNTQIVLGNEFTSKQLTSALIFSSDIGKKIKFNNVESSLVPYNQLNKNNHIIFIGNSKNTPTEFLSLLTDEELKLIEKNSVIKLVDSPFKEDKKLLLVLSNDEELLINAAKLMSSQNYVTHLKQSTITLNAQTKILDKIDSSKSNLITFKELGYENLIVKGPFTQEIAIDLHTPKNKVVSSGSKLQLNMKYADNLDFNRSLVTVYVNDIPIGSKKLSQENHEADSIEIVLPDELLNKNYYQIKVVFNLELIDLQCVTRDMDIPWAHITNDSMMNLVYRDQTSLTFSSYPYPFITESAFNNVTVVIPSKLSINELSELSNMFVNMGRDLQYNTGSFEVVKDSEFNSSMHDNNLLIYGTAANNSLIKEINKDLNLPYDNNFEKLGNEELITFYNELGSSIGSLQLTASPFNKKRAMLVVTSPSETQLASLTNYLSDLSLVGSLKGDTVVVYPSGVVDDLILLNDNVQDVVEPSESSTLVIDRETVGFIVVAVLLFVTLGTSAWLLIRRHKK